MKNNLFFVGLIYLSFNQLTAQTNKNTKDEEDIKPTFVQQATYPSKNIVKPLKSGGTTSITPNLGETTKAVKNGLEPEEKPKPKDASKDPNAIEYHETFRPFVEEKLDVATDSLYFAPETPAIFLGGAKAMNKFIETHIETPKLTANESAKGVVFVNLIINKEGVIEKATLLRGLQDNVNNEALKVIKKMPKWLPAKQKGLPVKSFCTIPIVFSME